MGWRGQAPFLSHVYHTQGEQNLVPSAAAWMGINYTCIRWLWVAVRSVLLFSMSIFILQYGMWVLELKSYWESSSLWFLVLATHFEREKTTYWEISSETWNTACQNTNEKKIWNEHFILQSLRNTGFSLLLETAFYCWAVTRQRVRAEGSPFHKAIYGFLI